MDNNRQNNSRMGLPTMPRNPTKVNHGDGKNHKPISRNIKTLTHQETALLLNELCCVEDPADHTPRRIRNYTIALLMLDAGLRVGEVCGLQIRDLIYNGEPVLALTIRPETSKSNVERTLPLSSRLQDAIRLMMLKLPNAGCLPGQRPMFYRGSLERLGKIKVEVNLAPITTRQVQRIIGAASFAAFGHSVHPHALRHTFGTRLAKVLPIKGVQDALGHRQLSSTQIYIHPDREDLKNGIAAITEDVR